jgi:ferrous iron transport protein A
MSTTFNSLVAGDNCRILGFTQPNTGYRKKLLAMGLTPGTAFTVKRLAPLGDPIEIYVRGFSLSLRKTEASVLSIEKL